jgi:hypothetical protein
MQEPAFLKLKTTATGRFTAKADPRWQSFPRQGELRRKWRRAFGRQGTISQPLKIKGRGDLELQLSLDAYAGTDRLTGEITENNTAFATISADRALYTSKADAAPPMLAVPAGWQVHTLSSSRRSHPQSKGGLLGNIHKAAATGDSPCQKQVWRSSRVYWPMARE